MKSGMQFSVLFLVAAMAAASGVSVEMKDRTITKVVKVLQQMLVDSKAEGEEERKIYSKFKCYCDINEEEKKDSIRKLGKQIAVLQSKIDALKGSSGQLSKESGTLAKRMDGNKEARDNMQSMRDKEAKEYKETDDDFVAAIAQMNGAINTLAEIGADQTANTDAGHEKAMGGFDESKMDASKFGEGGKFIQVKVTSAQEQAAKKALAIAQGYMTPKQAATTASFMQAPFTGDYSSQSGEVVGILKNMRDTFKQNKADADKKEAEQIANYKEFMGIKTKAFKSMEAQYDQKQSALAANDMEKAAKEEQMKEASDKKNDDEGFLAELQKQYKEKTAGYENRKMLRANEDAAISECVSILNSDEAFETFGKTKSTTTGSEEEKPEKSVDEPKEEKELERMEFVQKTPVNLIQMSAIRRHLDANEVGRNHAKKVLESGAKATKSARLNQVLLQLKAHNPFDEVLKEIDAMVKVIAEEQKSDEKKRDHCIAEREKNNDNLDSAEDSEMDLRQTINKLTNEIEDPATGLKAMIQESEDSLETNRKNQKEETDDRREVNQAYQTNIKNLVASQNILKKAIKVLKAYYTDLSKKLEAGEAAFLQTGKQTLLQKSRQPEAVDAPEAWKGEGAYEGQSTKGNAAVEQLEFILEEAQTDEQKAHEEENQAQHDYEDAMADLKKEEADTQKSLGNLRNTLAQKQKELLSNKEDHKDTSATIKSIKAYLLSIKPGCDFMMAKFEKRSNNRDMETDSLTNAKDLIRGTPAYSAFEKAAHEESLGECKDVCLGKEDQAKCKACQADVTVAGYCAGHADTPGC